MLVYRFPFCNGTPHRSTSTVAQKKKKGLRLLLFCLYGYTYLRNYNCYMATLQAFKRNLVEVLFSKKKKKTK